MGKWKGGKWIGPPRSTLESKFHLWCSCLAEGTDIGEEGEKEEVCIKVQEEHFQNTFIWATRPVGVGGNMPALSSTYTEQGTGYNPKVSPAAVAVAVAAGRDGTVTAAAGGGGEIVAADAAAIVKRGAKPSGYKRGDCGSVEVEVDGQRIESMLAERAQVSTKTLKPKITQKKKEKKIIKKQM